MGQLEGSGVHLVGLGGLVVWSRPDQTHQTILMYSVKEHTQ
jgi:hypothetical protein